MTTYAGLKIVIIVYCLLEAVGRALAARLALHLVAVFTAVIIMVARPVIRDALKADAKFCEMLTIEVRYRK